MEVYPGGFYQLFYRVEYSGPVLGVLVDGGRSLIDILHGWIADV